MWWDWIAKTEQEAPTLRKPSRPSVLSRASNRAIPRETAWVVQQRAPNHHHGHAQATKRHRKKSGRYILVYFSPAVTTWTSIYSYNSSWIFKTIYIQVRKMYILYSYLFIYIYIIWALIWKYWQSSLQIYTVRFIWQATNIIITFFL